MTCPAMNRQSAQRLAASLATLLLYAAVSLLVLHLFMLGNGWFRETKNGFALDRMLSFTAARPFAYRVLTPALVNAGAALFPDSFIRERGRWLTQGSPLVPYARTSLFMNARMALKVHVLYAYSFFSLLCLLYAARAITRRLYRFPGFFSAVAPAAAVLLLPCTFRWGSHIYDFPELLLTALCLLTILTRRWAWYYLLYALAILNKEASAFIILFFLALRGGGMPRKAFLRHAAAQLCIGAALVGAVRLAFAHHPLFLGSTNYLRQNLAFWLDPASYTLFWDAYKVGLNIVPRASNIVFIGAAAFLVCCRWREKPLAAKRLFLYATAFNLPLFVYFGWADEIRTLGLMFPGMYLLGAHTLYRLLYAGAPGARAAARGA